MSIKIAGIPLGDIREQIPPALRAYGELTNGQVQFDIDQAVRVEPTPDRPNSARSESLVHMGDLAIKLFVIVFAPGDGTGDESAHTLNRVVFTGGYPRETKVVPRSKSPVEAESHLTIATFTDDGVAVPFAGCLDVIGFGAQPNSLVRIATVGQAPSQFLRTLSGSADAGPTATYTVERASGLGQFGDPHAVFEDQRLLQVCAFAAVPRGERTAILSVLGSKLPTR